jgi:NADPH:quinone reductase-like Zn-dependent oxidoreductase
VVFDPVGGPTVAKLMAAMSRLGILFQYGALSPEPTVLPVIDLLGKSLTVRGYVLFEVTGDPASLERGKEFVVSGLALGKLKPVIAKTFPFDQIVDAAPVLGIEPANRKNCGHRVIAISDCRSSFPSRFSPHSCLG